MLNIDLNSTLTGVPSLQSESRTTVTDASPGKTLFVGDSYTHGHFNPVRTYNAESVNDLNANAPDGSPAHEDKTGGEAGPWGGIPGIFQSLAHEQGLNSSANMDAISATPLTQLARDSKSQIGSGSFDNVIMQDKTNEGLDSANNAGTAQSELQRGSKDVSSIVQQNNPSAHTYLNESPAPPDTVKKSGESSSSLTAQNHKNFANAAAANGATAINVGDAFQKAVDDAVADAPPPKASKADQKVNGDDTLLPTPAGAAAQAGTQPTSVNPNIGADGKIQLFGEDDHHPSSAGAYLSALVQYGAITKIDPRSLGANDQTAAQLDIPTEAATALQNVAAQTLTADGVALHQAPAQ